MKKYMMVAVFGIIALVLTFFLMPAVTTAPSSVAEAEADSDMSVGTEVVLSNSTVATYLGKTSEGNYKWQATVDAPKYLDDLTTPIDCRWEYDAEKAEWNTCANLFNATAKGSKITVWYEDKKLSWQPDVWIGDKKLKASTEQLLINDPINENYFGNTLQWDYEGIIRNVRIIEGMLIEYYTISQLPTGDIVINSHTEKDAGFVWTRPASAWDNESKPVDLIVDGDDITLALEVMKNATLPITIDPDTPFTTSASDGCLQFWPAVSYSVARGATEASGPPETSIDCFDIGQLKEEDHYYIARAFVYFDTASLPEGITITSVTLKLFGKVDFSDQDFYIQIQNGMPTYPHDPMTQTDYDKNHYSGNGGQLATTNFIVGSYNEITLTSEGRSWINTAGWTKFCLRSSRDINPFNEPTGWEVVGVYSYEKGANYYPELVVTYEEPPLSLLEQYAPVLYLHPNEDYYNDPINSMLNESDLMLLELNGYRDHIQDGPIGESELPGSSAVGVYYLDMWNATPAPFGESWKAEKPDPARFTGYPLTVYGRQVDKTYGGHNYIVLQYWFFYPYNDWHNCHEGDMERIQIILDKATGTPINVTFGQHWGGKTVPWNGGVSFIEGTHPKVFVAQGSHASYPTDGDHPVGPCTDETSSTGLVSFPTGYVNEYDIPTGNKKGYTLTDISGEPSWVKWSGIWGFYFPEFWGQIGQSGPPSPANLKVNHINVWNDPIAWANSPGSPWIIGQATGPVRLHAYDSNGNHTGLNETGAIETEIPGTYFYVPAGNQSEAELMWIYTEENLTFTLEATGAGESNFSFARCVGGEITTNYSHINVKTEDTTAKVDTGGGNTLLLMEMDFDSNGVTDEYKFPDSNSTLKGQVSFAGRGTPPNDRWIEPFNVTLFEPGNLSNVLWTGVATTNNTGVFTIDNIPSNTTYDIGIKNWTCLSELVTNVTVGVNETVVVDFGIPREGDTDNDDQVKLIDFNRILTSYGAKPGDPNWNPMYDFNRSGRIDTADFNLVLTNYGGKGDAYGYF